MTAAAFGPLQATPKSLACCCLSSRDSTNSFKYALPSLHALPCGFALTELSAAKGHRNTAPGVQGGYSATSSTSRLLAVCAVLPPAQPQRGLSTSPVMAWQHDTMRRACKRWIATKTGNYAHMSYQVLSRPCEHGRERMRTH